MRWKKMLNPNNIKAISYDYKNEVMEIELKKPEVINGFNKKTVKMKCNCDTFQKYVNKWQKVIN
jgi:1,4-dihydroxy-2-naphthoyl-CoA synthase